MAKIKKFVSINAPLDRVFEYLTHPEHLPEIWPSMIEVSGVQRKADGSHSFDWVYKMAGVHFNGHAETTEIETNKRVVVRNDKGIPSTFYWTYSGENGGTRVTLEVDYTLPGRVLDKLAEPFLHRVNEREAESMLENLKARMEIGMQPGKTAPQPRR